MKHIYLISKKKTLCVQTGLFFIICLVFLFICSGCTNKSVSLSFAGTMDQIDAYIASGQIKDANVLLKNMAKSASAIGEWFAVYKRYIRTANTEEAEKVIKKAFSKNPNRADVIAVYSDFLVSQKQHEKALKIASRLAGTQYGSVLTEIKLKCAKNINDYLNQDFIQTFCDAAVITGNDAYLRNAAVIYAFCGYMQEAIMLHQIPVSHNQDNLFWALISYDAGNFTQTYIDLSTMADSPEVLLLKADAALYLNEQKDAYLCWRKVATDFDVSFSPIPLYNMAHFAHLNKMQSTRGKLLIELSHRFPMYIPGLAAYGNYSYDIMHRVQEDSLTAAVRNAGLKSLKMEEEDAAPLIPVEDALARMDEAAKATGDTKILVEKEKLLWRESEKSNEEKLIDVWLLLEKYPDNGELNQYAVWLLCMLKRYDEARSLFNNYIEGQYKSTDYIDLKDTFTALECEYAAYLSALNVPNDINADYKKAVELYETLITKGSNTVPVLMNYGSIHFSRGNLVKAFELYGAALQKSADTVEKAELQYRIARIYSDQNDIPSAKMCLTYCLSLNPDHPKARLLYKQLEAL